MSVSKDTTKGTWTVYARYTDWQGKVKVLHKRGFKTKREAVEYERERVCQVKCVSFADWFAEKMLFSLGCVVFAVVMFAILIHFDLIWYMW